MRSTNTIDMLVIKLIFSIMCIVVLIISSYRVFLAIDIIKIKKNQSVFANENFQEMLVIGHCVITILLCLIFLITNKIDMEFSWKPLFLVLPSIFLSILITLLFYKYQFSPSDASHGEKIDAFLESRYIQEIKLGKHIKLPVVSLILYLII